MSMTYIAFLRAVNVGGRTVKMDYLRELFRGLGFTNVRTYIQSGNVFFDTSERDKQLLTEQIEGCLERALGFKVEAMVRSVADLEEVVQLNPFEGHERSEDVRFCILFVPRALPRDTVTPLFSPKRDCEIIATTEGAVFVVVHLQNGKWSNPSGFVDKLTGGVSTARFFHTAEKILAAAKA